jgi:YidC/Oxa1 family membrane protein insertase
MFHSLEQFILSLLQILYQLTQSYGWSIVILTALIKLVFYPLTKKQFSSMKKMKELQPALKEIQTRNKQNPQQLQKEMMELYRKHKVNPLAGCLPLLVQMPFLIGLFLALNGQTFKEIIQTPGVQASFLWMTDISKPDPLNLLALVGLGSLFKLSILPILVAVSTYLTQKMMSGSGADPQTEKMLSIFIPGMMFFVSVNLPSGVLIYWVVSNFATVLQQMQMMAASNQSTAVSS